MVELVHRTSEQVERQLPGWSAITDDGEFVTERHFRDVSAIPHRKVAVLPPRHLLTINWADSGPGYSWPVAYYVAWLPYYDRFVVTASADCPEGFGYCDVAIGSFGIETPLKALSGSERKQHEIWATQLWIGGSMAYDELQARYRLARTARAVFTYTFAWCGLRSGLADCKALSTLTITSPIST